MLIMLGLIVAVAVLGPLFGSDSRDGLDWAPNGFWLPRRDTCAKDLGKSDAGKSEVRRSDSPAPAAGGRASADACRTIPAAG
jgi:hypothetical protein